MISLAILVPVGLYLVLAFAIGWKKPSEGWERPVGILGMVAIGISLVLLVTLSASWFYLGRPLLEVPLPWGLLGMEPVFLWDEATALWSMVTALMGLATIRFSVTYLHRETGYVRFMAIALAFLGSMLGAIAADNPVQMAAWWEIIGASSVLLIGFYHERPGPCTGAVAVFRQYRIADAGMLLGCGLMLAQVAKRIGLGDDDLSQFFQYFLVELVELVGIGVFAELFLGFSPLFLSVLFRDRRKS